MVLVAAVALGSSTYAWFASNNNVKAEKMNVTADVKFLEIQHAKGTIKKPLSLSPWYSQGRLEIVNNRGNYGKGKAMA